MEAVMAKKRKAKKAAKKKKKKRAASKKAKRRLSRKPAKKGAAPRKSASKSAKPRKKVARKLAVRPGVPAIEPAASDPATGAVPGVRTALNPAAAWPFPTGSRP
jgi:hypothetical protein